MFAAAYLELYLTPEELTGLLKQDKVSAAKSKKAVTAYSKLTGQKVATKQKASVVVREKTTDDESATVETKAAKPAKQSVAAVEAQIDKLYLLLEQLQEQQS